MKLVIIGKYPLKTFKNFTGATSVCTHTYTYTHTRHKSYVYAKSTVYIWKSTPLGRLTVSIPDCPSLSQSLIGCLGTWPHSRKVYLGDFSVSSPTSLKATETMRKRICASSWCCWLVWNNHFFFQLKDFTNLLTCSMLQMQFG